MKSKIHWLTAFGIGLTIIALIWGGKIAVRAKQTGDNSPTINAQAFQFKGKTAKESKVNLIPMPNQLIAKSLCLRHTL